MSLITEPKTYTGKDLETIFFRPMLSGPDANELGIRVLYNMPVPTTISFWRQGANVLQKYSAGWEGGPSSEKFQKSIQLHKVKAEMGYMASDYFSMVFEQITNRADVNLDDLTGTELEEAETKLFKEAIAESIRATMWLGYTDRPNGKFNTFNGFISSLIYPTVVDENTVIPFHIIENEDYDAENAGEKILKSVWDKAPVQLKECKNQGQLAYFVTSDIYSMYEDTLDSAALEAAYIARQQGRESLTYRGIPVIDMRISSYAEMTPDIPRTAVILTDRRNLTLAVNTADFPGTEVRMWYNPDEMENRQRAVFMAGCDFLLPELIYAAFKL